MTAATRPFDDIRALISAMPEPDAAAIAAVREREGQLTKPAGSLGRLEEIAEWLAGWQRTASPHADTPLVAVFAGNHGVVAQGRLALSAVGDAGDGRQFLLRRRGDQPDLQDASTFRCKVFELALEAPTGDITQEPALDEKGCAATMAFGMEALASRPDLLCLGEMGIGNTTVAAAIYHALYGGEAEDWVGRGTGVDEAGLDAQGRGGARRRRAASRASRRSAGSSAPSRRPRDRGDGGRDPRRAHAARAGRARRLRRLRGGGGAACARPVSARSLHRRACFGGEARMPEVLRRLGKTPLLDLGMRLGEGTGAALAVGIVSAAVACHNGMATFAEAGVAGKEG